MDGTGLCFRAFPAMPPVLQPLFNSVAAAALIVVIGAFSLQIGSPVLFASLAPTIALQVVLPQSEMSKPWNVAVGHLLGLGSAMAAVYITGAVHVPAFSDGNSLTWLRVGAAAIAILFGIVLEALLRASHAPSAATTLLIALGMMPPTGRTAWTVVCGVALVTTLGEGVRRMRLRLFA